MQLLRPATEHLPSYISALQAGWSPDNLRPEVAQEELASIARDAAGYLARKVDREAAGGPVTLPDGSQVARLPGFVCWVWDGGFCGSINFRWQHGTAELPAHVLGHVGYAVVPWKRNLGHATEALRQLLPMARAEGLPFIDLTTDPDNIASQRVIERNAGVLIERFIRAPAYGSTPALRYRITL